MRSEPPGLGLLRSIVGDGAVVGGAVPLEEEDARPLPPESPLHATSAARMVTDSHLATDWERTPSMGLFLYLSASARQYLDVRFVARGGRQDTVSSNTVKSDGRGISRFTAKPARSKRARYSDRVRSLPDPVRISISRSMTLAKLGAGPSGTGISVTSTRAPDGIACRMLRRIVVQRSS